MKTFKVKETYLVTGWTYIKAETLEDAEAKLDRDEVADFKEVDNKHEKTFWDTLQETK